VTLSFAKTYLLDWSKTWTLNSSFKPMLRLT